MNTFVCICLKNTIFKRETFHPLKYLTLNHYKRTYTRHKGKLLPSQMSERRIWCYDMQILPSATIFPPSTAQLCGVVCHVFITIVRVNVLRVFCAWAHVCTSVRVWFTAARDGGLMSFRRAFLYPLVSIRTPHAAWSACSPQEEETTFLPTSIFSHTSPFIREQQLNQTVLDNIVRFTVKQSGVSCSTWFWI